MEENVLQPMKEVLEDEPKTADLPLLVGSLAHFLFILVCCQVIRFIANLLVNDRRLRVYIEESICTLQLCMNNFELSVITEVYGFSGYAVGLFFTSISYSLTFQDGLADPSECLDKYCKRQMGARECFSRSLFSVMGAGASYRACKVFWSLGVIPEHVVSFQGLQPCTASLQVSVLLGLFFEASETFVNRLIQNSHGFNMLSGGLADVAITFCGLFVTGGYFNPSLAFAMEFGCSGITAADFFLIYFIGPAVGTLVALQTGPPILRAIQDQLAPTPTAKEKKRN